MHSTFFVRNMKSIGKLEDAPAFRGMWMWYLFIVPKNVKINIVSLQELYFSSSAI